jgi:hypothetical protein
MIGGDQVTDYTTHELRVCAEREVAMRRRVYASWVEKGRMSQQQADLEIEKMAAIANYFFDLEQRERLL